MAKATRKKKEETPITDQPVVVETNDTTAMVVNSPEPEKSKDDTPTPPPAQTVVTQEIVTARMKAELTKDGYQDKLQKFTDLKVTEDNMAAVQQELKNMRGFLRKMDEIKTAGKKPALDRCRMWDAAYNDLSGLLEEELRKKQAVLNKIAQEQEAKAEKIRKEKQRKDDINTAIDNFILQQSQAIAGAKSDDELVAIQKNLGSHKANSSRYQEFLPDLVERCNALNPLINTQKDAIRKLRQLEEEKKEAEKKGDDATLIAIEEQKEQLNATLDEQKVLVQETAINQATKTGDVIIAEPVIATVKARRTKWKAELKSDDKSVKAALNAGLLKCTLDPDKIDVLIETLKQTKQLEGKEEFEINGVRLWLEKLY